MNMFITYHVHHLSTEMKDKNLQKCTKACLKILAKLLLYSKYGLSSITGKKGHLYNIAEIKNEAVGFPDMPPCGKGIYIR